MAGENRESQALTLVLDGLRRMEATLSDATVDVGALKVTLAKIESDVITLKEDVNDHEGRLRPVESVKSVALFVAALLGALGGALLTYFLRK